MIPIEELKVALRIPLANVANDDAIGRYETAAVAYVERFKGRYYGTPKSFTEFITGGDEPVFWLKETPIGSVTVTQRWDTGDDGTVIVATDDNGFVVRDRRLFRKGGAWLGGYEYEITYTAGYEGGAEPCDVRQAVGMLVTHWYTQRVPTTDSRVLEVPHTVTDLLGGRVQRV